MKAQWVWIAAAVFTVAANAQSSTGVSEAGSAATQAGHATASAAQAASVSAELTKGIDSRKAKVGDEVFAKTMSEARLADGTRIPKGSKLLGHVTEALAKSKDNRNGYVAFSFDHAALKDGREVPVSVVVRALAAPAPMAPTAGSDDPMAGGRMQGADVAPGGGGLASNGPGGALHSAGGVAGGVQSAASSGVNQAGSGIDGTVNGVASEGGALGADARARVNGAGLNDGAAGGGAVGNLSGVTFATVHVAAISENGGAGASGGATTGTLVTARNRNVNLDGGSQMTLIVSPR
jgi:hypothetical protein